MMIFRSLKPDDSKALMSLFKDFHNEISRLRGKTQMCSPDEARQELDYFNRSPFTLYVAEEDELAGYAVFKIYDNTVWVEQLYVRPEYRRQGVGRQFLVIGEALADNYGQETVYFWVHPDNTAMLQFLKKTGYDVLNLVEIRRQREAESCCHTVQLFESTVRYCKGKEGG
jgi:ribosomal protein S18 acetylase RimI-like enzyme